MNSRARINTSTPKSFNTEISDEKEELRRKSGQTHVNLTSKESELLKHRIIAASYRLGKADLGGLFDRMDRDHNGTIDADELESEKAGVTASIIYYLVCDFQISRKKCRRQFQMSTLLYKFEDVFKNQNLCNRWSLILLDPLIKIESRRAALPLESFAENLIGSQQPQS